MSITTPVSASDIREFESSDGPLDGDEELSSQFTQAISPILALRVAQAAAGYVGSNIDLPNEIFIVASYQTMLDTTQNQQDYIVFPPKKNLTLARKLRSEQPNPSDFGIFGPFSLIPDAFEMAPSSGQGSINKVLLTPTFPDLNGKGRFEGAHFAWDGYDAVFMSAAAVQKFVIPYYTSVYGPTFAETLQTQFSEAPIALMGHLPWTEYQIDQTATGGVSGGERYAMATDVLHLPKLDENGNVSDCRNELRPPPPAI